MYHPNIKQLMHHLIMKALLYIKWRAGDRRSLIVDLLPIRALLHCMQSENYFDTICFYDYGEIQPKIPFNKWMNHWHKNVPNAEVLPRIHWLHGDHHQCIKSIQVRPQWKWSRIYSMDSKWSKIWDNEWYDSFFFLILIFLLSHKRSSLG